MPNKYKKLPGTCTLYLMPIVFGAPQPQVSLSISKPVKPTAPHLQLPPCKGHPAAAGMDPLPRSEAWFVRRMLKRDAGRALPVMR